MEFNGTDYEYQPNLEEIGDTYEAYGEAWRFLFPLIAETTLFGELHTLTALRMDIDVVKALPRFCSP